MDNAPPGKFDSPCFKQNRIGLFDVQRRLYATPDRVNP